MLLLSVSCGRENTFVAPPPLEVEVAPAISRDAQVFVEFPAQTSAPNRVEIRARVKGFLEDQEFQPGQYVEEGKLLFTIEEAQFQAAVDSAQGNLDKAKADLDIATTNHDKRKKAFDETKSVSEIDVLSARAEMEAAKAAVSIADAALKDAQRDLSYTKIHSPIAGRTSRALVDPGNLVGAADPTLLTTVVQDDPINVNFEADERRILDRLTDRPSADEPLIKLDDADRQLRLSLADGTLYPHLGAFDFVDNEVNPDTGTIAVRAVFENPEGALIPGLFVRIGLPHTIANAVLVPRTVVQRDLGGNFVLIAGAENKVERRDVDPTEFGEGDLRILQPFNESTGRGLKPGDLVIVSRLQQTRTGMEIKPTEVAMKPAGPGDSPAAEGKGKGEGEGENADPATESAPNSATNPDNATTGKATPPAGN